MTKILYGAPVVEKLKQQTKELIEQYTITGYLAIFVFGENHPGMSYVRRKIAYAKEIGLDTKLYTNPDTYASDVEHCNQDADCLGIIVQLPLPNDMQEDTQSILNKVVPQKDVDCLGEITLERSLVGSGELPIMPATPAAVLYLLDYYAQKNPAVYDVVSKKIAVLGEGILVGKSLAILLEKKGAEVVSFNEFSDQEKMRQICQKSDIIIGATGKIHLIDETFVNDESNQIIIDVGRGYKDGKPVGDVYEESIQDKVSSYTPVPGGIGPITVASLFWNIVQLAIHK